MQELKSLDWPEVLKRIETCATSEQAREELRKTAPLAGPTEARESFERILEALVLVQQGQRPHMESLDLYATWFTRLSRKGVLKTIELKDVRHFCIEVMTLKELIQPLRTRWMTAIDQQLMDAAEPLSAIDQIMTPSGEIRTDASETLFALTREKNDQIKTVKNALDRLVKAHEMEPILQDRYVTNREGRWVLPVRSGMQNNFQGIIHGSSQTKQTVFMEPQEIIPINNRLRQIEEEIEREIERLLSQLSEYLASKSLEFERARKVLAEMDVTLAKAQVAARMDAIPCEFSEDEIRLNDVRHPLLILSNKSVIANSVNLSPDRRILLLSGPNAGGKTVLLKAVGLAAHMARCGLLICAEEGSRLPFFERVFVGVGDAQSVDENLSTFAAHLKVLNEAIRAQGPKDLLLIDEICGSTDPEEGTALARSFITAYAESRAFGVITSHLGGLKLGWTPDSGVINGSLEYNSDSGPTYRFFMGVPGQSLALQTARRVGVRAEILERAKNFLTPELRRYQDGLVEIEALREELHKTRDQLEEETKKARADRERYQRQSQELEREKAKILEQALKKAERKVEELIEHAKVEQTFRRHEELQKIKQELPEVIKATGGGAAPLTQTVLKSAEDFAKAFPPGSRVFVASLARDGVVQSKPNSKGEVAVLSESIRLMVDWKLLKPPERTKSPAQEVLRRSNHYMISPADEERVIDVRGRTIEEALSELEIQLDHAAVAREDRVKVIHGHGTEALKRSIRSYLSRSTYVKKWQAGTPESGGDGITWIELKD